MMVRFETAMLVSGRPANARRRRHDLPASAIAAAGPPQESGSQGTATQFQEQERQTRRESAAFGPWRFRSQEVHPEIMYA